MHATLLAVLLVVACARSAKREIQATSCVMVGIFDPDFCQSASEGPLCLTAAEYGQGVASQSCGCKQDADCFTQPTYPYCIENQSGGGFCDDCSTALPANPNLVTDVSDHLFCRNRFPSKYLVSITPPMGFLDTSEKIAPSPSSYFRELCNRAVGQGGACEGCHQASTSNTPQQVFPTYSAAVTNDIAAILGARGSTHCRHVYPGTPTVPSRPICAFSAFWTLSGAGSLFTTALVDLDVARTTAFPDGPPQIESRTPRNWQGACLPCLIGGPVVGSPKIARHALCQFSDATRPICSVAGCSACASNADCGSSSGDVTCLTDGTCTGGHNCQKDGSCKTCLTSADCGSLDGGTPGNQAICDVVSGLCIDQPPCIDNADCPVGQNCMMGGLCKVCIAGGTDCVTNDGGAAKQNQPTCKAGVCVDCAVNADCTGTGGANCQANGKCLNCGAAVIGNANCGVADGGTLSSGQPICDPVANQCVDSCAAQATPNAFCGTRGGSDAFTKGANCQADGTCKDCTVTPDTCGALDFQNEPRCDLPTKVCLPPLFSCTNNNDCAIQVPVLEKNCQSNGACKNCFVPNLSTTVTYDATTSTCGLNKDGGMPAGQPNCDQTSRLCVGNCAKNSDCVGTQGANCMANFVCLSCRTDADCDSAGSSWGGDIDNQDKVCNSATGICSPRCADSDCPANSNCNKDGRCAPCTTDASCVTNDGPFPMGSNTICTNGHCGNPYLCNTNGNDNSDCFSNTGRKNCQADRSCKTCLSNADCGALDGGQVPGQPACNVATGICGPCTKNADCPTSAPNCGKNGGCYSCTTNTPATSCGGTDGGEIMNQPNCDPLTNICVSFCTSDDNCDDDCASYCNIERGCCVECTSDAHCPLANWRGSELGRTMCAEKTTCVFPVTCETDSDCPDANPACSIGEQSCVECLYDSHCGGSTPACSTSQQKCVECVFDEHCGVGEDDQCGSDQTCSSSASTLAASAGFFMALAAMLRL